VQQAEREHFKNAKVHSSQQKAVEMVQQRQQKHLRKLQQSGRQWCFSQQGTPHYFKSLYWLSYRFLLSYRLLLPSSGASWGSHIWAPSLVGRAGHEVMDQQCQDMMNTVNNCYAQVVDDSSPQGSFSFCVRSLAGYI
jgi:hypothetical protein